MGLTGDQETSPEYVNKLVQESDDWIDTSSTGQAGTKWQGGNLTVIFALERSGGMAAVWIVPIVEVGIPRWLAAEDSRSHRICAENRSSQTIHSKS